MIVSFEVKQKLKKLEDLEDESKTSSSPKKDTEIARTICNLREHIAYSLKNSATVDATRTQ
jgi:hypothetical protein